MVEPVKVSAGVEELIAQLRDDGVKAAQEEAEKIIKDARTRAAHLLEKARREVHELKSKSIAEIHTEKTASQEALKIAARDTIIRLSNEVRSAFEGYVKRLVTEQLSDEGFLKDLIIAIAKKNAMLLPEEEQLLVILSADPEVSGKASLDATEKKFRQFILKSTAGFLREGIDVKVSDDKFAGIKVQLKEKNIVIELTDQAISSLLVRHLMPRFRKIMTGEE
ncbi:MAG: hypothetical protein P9M13_08105 [Candidatus Ancaeobacter aquaticus]|nr:hypothetical protein [Candidatus Ancaeobacter aquaticus]